MKIHAFFWALSASCILPACGQQPEKYVEITSALPNTRVYLNQKLLGVTPIKLSESKLKELGLAYPYSIRNGNELWNSWDIDLKTSSALTVQNDPKSDFAGKFRFQATPEDSQYKTVKDGVNSWFILQLRFEPIGDMPDNELGRRIIAIPVKAEQGAAANP